ncbi:MAG: cyclic nucleotide-binding domain-containing protein [Bradymonadaceae bacterium]
MEQLEIDSQLEPKLLEALGGVPHFEDLDDDHIRTICGRATAYRYDEGQTIISAGEPSDSFMLLLHGTASVHLPGAGLDRGDRVLAL